jgi:biopolymer transport protein ExbB/TolQ
VRAYLGYKQQGLTAEQLNNKIGIVRSVGILALVLGILGQLLGLYDMFVAIQEMENVAPTLLAGGLKVSMITTLYGLIIFLVSLLLTILLKSVITGETE